VVNGSAEVGTAPVAGLSPRHRALLDAVRAGRCQLTLGRLPALLVEGRVCRDQQAADDLLVAGLVEPAIDANREGRLVAPAVLTTDGVRVLSSALRVVRPDEAMAPPPAAVPQPRRG
jgi:hypothetical protein